MTACLHVRIEAHEQHEDDMHCVGWICTDCGHQGLGECHHRTWCDPDFCGDEPVRFEVTSPGAAGG